MPSKDACLRHPTDGEGVIMVAQQDIKVPVKLQTSAALPENRESAGNFCYLWVLACHGFGNIGLVNLVGFRPLSL
jgi:hypothetical protein